MNRKVKFTEMSKVDQDKSKTVRFFVNEKKGTTTCIVYDRMYQTEYVGITRCHDTDVFDEMKGRAIAFNKARKKELESNLKLIAEEKRMLDEWYNKEVAKLEKRSHINIVYLTGAEDELKDLMK